MRRRFFAIVLLALAACGGKEGGSRQVSLSSGPISVRGWVLDVKGAQRGETVEIEIARRTQLFQSTSLWVEGVENASGGMAENGAFVVLDVPPGKAIIGFNAPGAESSQLVLENIPPNADVYIPNVILQNGAAQLLDPKQVIVRIPARVDRRKPTGQTAFVAGVMVPIIETPLAEMTDRRDYPQVPGYRPVATVR